MKLSRTQIRALKLAYRHDTQWQTHAALSTLEISGSTGASLAKKGLLVRHHEGGEYEGSNVSYTITRKGIDWLIENGHVTSAEQRGR